jgi:hypothetical protein
MTTFECPACGKGRVAPRDGKGRAFPYKQYTPLFTALARRLLPCVASARL